MTLDEHRDGHRKKLQPRWSGVGGALALAAIALCLVLPPLSARSSDGPAAVGAPPAWIAHPTEPFSITATEITVAQFRACVDAGACDPSTVNAACNYGQTDRDDHPVNCVAYQGAAQYCAHMGGRVCTEPEWLTACRGVDGRRFPYGNTFDLAACNVQSHTLTVEGRERATAPVGSLPTCEGGLTGLFDMAGNVAEWVDACKGTYCRFRGAGYLSNDPVEAFAACGSICSGNEQTFQSGIVGIRCCKDATE